MPIDQYLDCFSASSNIRFPSLDGELPMTMQVGMRGYDGLILAGDTWLYVDANNSGSWYGYSTTKIRIDSTNRMAVACARNMDVSNQITDEIFASLADSEPHKRNAQIRDIGTRVASGFDAECIVAFADPEPSMYVFLCDRNGNRRCDQVHDSVPIGSSSNSAYFWAMRYYKRDMSVRQLTHLASRIVVDAGAFSNGNIRGLEIVTCDKSGFHRWNEAQNSQMESEVQSMGERIGELALGLNCGEALS